MACEGNILGTGLQVNHSKASHQVSSAKGGANFVAMTRQLL